MTAFATAGDMSKLLNRTFTPEEAAWIEVLLETSAEYMRGHMGVVYPPVTATFTAWPSDGWVALPAYLRSIASVRRDGSPVSYRRVDNNICVHGSDPVSVTMTAGLESAPADLIGMNCVMVSQAMLPVELNLGISVGGLSSVALDDFKVAFADGGAGANLLALTEHSIDYLINRYGVSAYTTEANR